MFLFVTTLIFMFISKLRFPKKVSIVTIFLVEVTRGGRLRRDSAAADGRDVRNWVTTFLTPANQSLKWAQGEANCFVTRDN